MKITSQTSELSDASSQYMQEARGANRSGNKFTLPKFQGKMKALIGGIFATDKRTKFLQDYMNGLVSLNDAAQIKLLFTCTLFEDFIDLMSKLSKDGKEGDPPPGPPEGALVNTMSLNQRYSCLFRPCRG